MSVGGVGGQRARGPEGSARSLGGRARGRATRVCALALAWASALLVLGLLTAAAVSAESTPDTIFGSATPATVNSGDAHSVVLGVKFDSEVAGTVTGIRFYKAATNTGTHTGSLWSSTGTLLASATFTGETASGWQTVSFSTPVAIAAGTTYVASYLAPKGDYSDTAPGFATAGVSNPPLAALANSVSANGVYAYSSTNVFPTSTYKATNYWVDVDFVPTVTTAPGQVTNVSATAGAESASVSWSAPTSGGAVSTYTVTPYIGSTAQPASTVSGSPPATNVTVGGLKNGSPYTFKVQASNAAGPGPVSEPSNAVTPTGPTVPSAPTGVSATAGNGQATVTWAAPSANGSAITSYKVTPYVGSTAQTAKVVSGSPPATTTTIEGLTNGTAYTFTVSALNAIGEGPASSPSSAVTPSGESIAYPDLQVLVPTGDIAIVTGGSTKTLEFTHISEDAGAGPWELRPVYNSATGISQGYQALYTMPSPGVWKYAYSVPFAGPMIWTPPSDYNFPLNKFWLYTTNASGGLGSVVAKSPKVLYCMTSDTYVGGVPNTPADNEYPDGACEKPEGKLGLSVGWGDQYEATDGGEGIPITGLANGTYWLSAEIDPNHNFEESNTSNNITDTKIEITGNTVKVLEQTHPTSTPPTVTLTSPAANAVISGTTTLSATASGPAPIASVQFLLDGEPIGSPVTTPPYTLNWAAASATPGKHFLSAQATDTNGFVDTAPEVPVTIAGKVGSMTIGTDVSQTGTTTVTTPAFSTSEPGEVLLAFADSDGPSSGSQTLKVSGAGLTWSLVKRANAQAGDAEVWTATTMGSLLNATVTATAADSGYNASLTVLALSGAAGAGASAAASAAKSAPTVGLTATEAGSVAFATGEDSEKGIARTPGSGQELLAQTVETSAEETSWTQYATAPSTAAGQTLTLNDTAPTSDSWNMAAVEVLPSPPEKSAGEPPTVSIVNPTTEEIVSGTTQVTANVSDNVAISSVQFYLDGKLLGAPVTKAPYAVSWDTTEASNSSHALTAMATNVSGTTGESAPVSVTAQNPAEEEACFVMDLTVNATGKGTVTTQTFTNAEAGEQMYAFVSADGPAGAGKQSATVSGAGLTWTLVKRANTQSGDAEIWTADAKTELANATVTSTLANGNFDQSLTVISMQGSNGTGASATAGGASGEPSVSLTTQQAGSLVYAVGNDWDNAIARTLGPNQTLMRQDVDTVGGNTFWSQFASAQTGPVGSVVTMNDTQPTTDDWNMAAVEIVSDLG
jgi:hypothetical protein